MTVAPYGKESEPGQGVLTLLAFRRQTCLILTHPGWSMGVAEGHSIALVTRTMYWHLYLLLKYLSELVILFLMLYTLQNKRTRQVGTAADWDGMVLSAAVCPLRGLRDACKSAG
jgi:hypothetical protein